MTLSPFGSVLSRKSSVENIFIVELTVNRSTIYVLYIDSSNDRLEQELRTLNVSFFHFEVFSDFTSFLMNNQIILGFCVILKLSFSKKNRAGRTSNNHFRRGFTALFFPYIISRFPQDVYSQISPLPNIDKQHHRKKFPLKLRTFHDCVQRVKTLSRLRHSDALIN